MGIVWMDIVVQFQEHVLYLIWMEIGVLLLVLVMVFLIHFFFFRSWLLMRKIKVNKWKLDIDECLTNNGGCDKHAICTNTQGSFTCSCEDGYSGDGIICNDSSKSEKNQSNNQAVGIGVGVSFGFLGLVGLILLVLFFIRKKVNLFIYLFIFNFMIFEIYNIN